MSKQKIVEKDQEFKVGEMTIRESWAPGRTSGHLHMTFADCGAKVSADGIEVGSIYAAVGGGVQVVIGKYTYFIPVSELWRVVYDMHVERKLE